MWNRLPLALREIVRPSIFRTKLIECIWSEFVFGVDNSSSLSEESDSDEEV